MEEENTNADERSEDDKKARSQARKKQFLQVLKFTAFSASAGVIQFLTISTLFDWTHWLPYWAAYVIGLTLSVIWNFTFNRKFTFASAANVPLAMCLVVVYNCLIVVPLAWGGDALAQRWGDPYGMVVTLIVLLINFVTEFFWDKFVVFNDKVVAKIESLFKRKKSVEKEETAEEVTSEAAPSVDVENEDVVE